GGLVMIRAAERTCFEEGPCRLGVHRDRQVNTGEPQTHVYSACGDLTHTAPARATGGGFMWARIRAIGRSAPGTAAVCLIAHRPARAGRRQAGRTRCLEALARLGADDP